MVWICFYYHYFSFIIKDFGLTTAEAGNLTLATTIGMWIGSYILDC